MTAQTDLRDAMMDLLMKDQGDVETGAFGAFEAMLLDCNIKPALYAEHIANLMIALLARWECKEPGDCPGE